MDIRAKAVIFYEEGLKRTEEICQLYGISDRTLRRWAKSYKIEGLKGLEPKKTGPKKSKQTISSDLEQKILKLKQKHPSWGARRIKFQYDLPCHFNTVHNTIKHHKMLVRIKAKPQPCKRFQRKHADSMWQGDTFQFRIHDVGKVYVTGFTDDCSRYRVNSGVYLNINSKSSVHCLRHTLRKGRIPKEIYLDNGKQFVAKVFKAEALKHKIKLIFGKPYHPQGRGKIERYHKTLHQELICAKTFTSLAHFKKELRKFDKSYNYWRKQEVHDWNTPASIYNDKRYFNKNARYIN